MTTPSRWGGASLDESYRLEPTQLAGFPQAFRNLINDPRVGSVAGPRFETAGVALDLKLGASTYAGIRLQRLATDVSQSIGDFVVTTSAMPGTMPQQLNYVERDLSVNVNQLLGRDFVMGAAYQLTQSHLDDLQPAVPAGNRQVQSVLHTPSCYVLMNLPSGFFARAEADWYSQANAGFSPAEPGQSFWQANLYLGWNLAHRRAQLFVGVLNLSGGDYRLEPLTPYQELPRKRTAELRLSFVF